MPRSIPALLRIVLNDPWKGLVHKPNRRYRPDDYLPDYGRLFTTVEIDQWFWSLFHSGVKIADPDVVRRYAYSLVGRVQ